MTWYQRLLAAKQRMGFTKNDVRLAESFTTCAIGEAFKIQSIGAKGMSRRLSREEETLGLDFYSAVKADLPDRALTLYRRIRRLKLTEVSPP